jgi:hypothetical protein
MVDRRRARAQAFVEAKLHAQDRRVPYPKELVEWFMEFEDLLHTSEKLTWQIYEEHMKLCPHSFLLPEQRFTWDIFEELPRHHEDPPVGDSDSD